MWRLIMEKRATLAEIDSAWSINDLADANVALDAWHAAERRAQEKARR